MKDDAMWRAIGLIAFTLTVVGSVFIYQSQNVFDWPKTYGAANDAAQVVALLVAGGWALNRFVVTRASRTCLEMSASAKVVGGTDENLLIQVVVRLKNIGTSRINARKGHQAGKFLYDDGGDQCEHAGTLKIRAVPQGNAPTLFDWYGLQPIKATLTSVVSHDTPAQIVATLGVLEQINYLADFQDPVGGFQDADFWLEPNEVYELTVPLRLARGDYAVKAFFLGDEKRHLEEEYWSHTVFCRLEASPANTPLQPTSGVEGTSSGMTQS
jgi:hypothetical protein